VGNHRMALDAAALGVPVLSVGVPTVVDVNTVARDILAETGGEGEPACLRRRGRNLFVTPDSIDSQVRELGRVLGWGISMALQPGLTVEDLVGLMG